MAAIPKCHLSLRDSIRRANGDNAANQFKLSSLNSQAANQIGNNNRLMGELVLICHRALWVVYKCSFLQFILCTEGQEVHNWLNNIYIFQSDKHRMTYDYYFFFNKAYMTENVHIPFTNMFQICISLHKPICGCKSSAVFASIRYHPMQKSDMQTW